MGKEGGANQRGLREMKTMLCLTHHAGPDAAVLPAGADHPVVDGANLLVGALALLLAHDGHADHLQQVRVAPICQGEPV